MDTQNIDAVYRPGFCPPVGHRTLGKVVIGGLLLNAAYQLINILLVFGLFISINVGLGSMGVGYATTSQDKWISIVLAVLGTALPSLMLIPALIAVVMGVYAAIHLYRGGRSTLLFASAIGSTLGISAYVLVGLLSLLILSIFGLLVIAMGAVMTVVSILIAALTVSLVANETARAREEAEAA